MKFIIAAFVGVMVTINTGAQAADCTLKEVTSVQIEQMPDGALAVPIKIEGVDEKFLLDFNFPFSAIAPETAEALKLPSFALGKSNYTIKSLNFGAIQGSNFLFYAMPAGTLTHGAAGVLGLDLLSHYDVELDLKRNKLNLFSTDHCPGQGVYWTDSAAIVPFSLSPPFGHVVLKGELDGKPIKMGLPGPLQPHSITMMGVLSKVLNIPADSPDLKALPGNNPQVFRYPFKTLALGSVVMNNPVIDIYQSDNDLLCGENWTNSSVHKCFEGEGVQLQLGLDEFKPLRLYFAFKEGLLYITSADASRPTGTPPTK